jgi:hypothetical protein
MNQPRGIRNHNPGNIRLGAKWKGLAAVQADGAFCQFTAPVWGLRALAKVLLAYRDRHDLRTVAQIVGRWAPPGENDTAAYVRDVARHLNVAPDAPLDLDRHLPGLIEAIVRHENGVQPYDATMIEAALALARE